jgi:hypothetical protein
MQRPKPLVTPFPELDTRVLVRDPMILDDLDPTIQIFSEFREPGVHDAVTPNLLSLQSPNSDMGIHV